ncbi:hypothetical protein D3C87_624470 [compost metagenome]
MSVTQLWKAIIECGYACTETEARHIALSSEVRVNGEEIDVIKDDKKIVEGALVEIVGVGEILI